MSRHARPPPGGEIAYLCHCTFNDVQGYVGAALFMLPGSYEVARSVIIARHARCLCRAGA